MVYDSAHNNLLHRLDKDGRVWQSLHVRGPKDEPFRLYDSLAVDPDGHIWASDGARLFRCDPTGRADVALGGLPEGAMARPVALTIDRQGRIYALEEGTAAVHMFDPAGKPIRVMKPEPTDTPTQDALAWITAEDDGRVRYRMTYEGPIVSFDSDGKRLGTEMPPPPWKQDGDRWEPIGRGWEHNGSDVRRCGPKGNILKIIRHRPDGAWLVTITDAAAAEDGSLAVLCKREEPGSMFSFGGGPGWLCLYGPDGEGAGVIGFQKASMFYNVARAGAQVVLSDEKGLTVLETPLDPARAARRCIIPGPEEAFWKTMVRPDGTVTTWSAGSRTVQHWKLPDPAH